MVGAWVEGAGPTWFSEEEDGRRRMGRGWRPSMKQEVTEMRVEAKLREVVEEQEGLGLDVITDGEVPRENYYLHFIRNGVRGIDLSVLSDKVRLARQSSELSLPPPGDERRSLRVLRPDRCERGKEPGLPLVL